MRKLIFKILILTGVVTILMSVSNYNSIVVSEEKTITDNVSHPLYEQTIKDFTLAVETNDAHALFGLVDLNYEGDVYWTVKEAQDLIDFFTREPHALEQQVRYLENSVTQIELLKKLAVYPSDKQPKRIPFAPSDEGLVFLQPDGKLSVKVFKHTLVVNERTLEDFDEIIINYKHTEKEFKYNQSSIRSRTYKNHDNEKVIDIINVGPGNYILEGTRIYGGDLDEYTETIQLIYNDMLKDSREKNIEIIYLHF